MSDATGDIPDIDAFGRAVFLGQLYSFPKSTLIVAPQCWDDVDDKTTMLQYENFSSNKKEITSVKDRSDLLSVKGSISVGIMSGMIELSGSGSYLDDKKSTVSTTEYAIMGKQQTHVKKVDYGTNSITLENLKRFQAIGATHVVTEIVYGGSIVCSFKSTSMSSSQDTQIGGSFSVKVAGAFGDALSLNASVEAQNKMKQINETKDMTFTLHMDCKLDKTPVQFSEAIEAVAQWTDNLKKQAPPDNPDGWKDAMLPLSFTLSPITRFVDSSAASQILQDLGQQDLTTVINAYNNLMTLNSKRAALANELATYATMFPTLYNRCAKRSANLNKLTVQARQDLAEFLQKFRAAGGSAAAGSVDTFIQSAKAAYDNDQFHYKADNDAFTSIMFIKKAADDNNAAIVDVDTLRSLMANVDGALGLIIIGPNTKLPEISSMFSTKLGLIRKWRKDQDSKLSDQLSDPNSTDPRGTRNPTTGKVALSTTFATYYDDNGEDDDPDTVTTPAQTPVTDPVQVLGTKADLLTVDGPMAKISKAVAESEKTREVRFVYYDFVTVYDMPLDSIDWFLMGDNGWGYLNKVTDEEQWSYVGEVRNSRQHGQGQQDSADGSSYSGSWWDGEKYGDGTQFEPPNSDGVKPPGVPGVYIANQKIEQGIVIGVTAYSKGRPIRYRRVPFDPHGSVQAHVANIAKMMEWREGYDSYKITFSSDNTSGSFEISGSTILDSSFNTGTWQVNDAHFAVRADRDV